MLKINGKPYYSSEDLLLWASRPFENDIARSTACPAIAAGKAAQGATQGENPTSGLLMEIQGLANQVLELRRENGKLKREKEVTETTAQNMQKTYEERIAMLIKARQDEIDKRVVLVTSLEHLIKRDKE